MALKRSGVLALMVQPETLPSLFATAEPEAPPAPRPRVPVGQWPARLRGWLGRDLPRGYHFRDRSAASW